MDNNHDKFCALYEGPCCPWLDSCDCQCDCDRIRAIREDTAENIIADARDAVNAQPYGGFVQVGQEQRPLIYMEHALSAIDALRETRR